MMKRWLRTEWRAIPLTFGHRSLRGRWYLAVSSETYLGFLVPGVVTTPIGGHSSPAYGRMHSGTECLVHVEVTWFFVNYALDFR
jgi:hypothetical protein